MLNILIKALLLVVLAGIIVVTWQFDMTFVNAVFAGVFPPGKMEVIGLVAASVFVSCRILIYWFWTERKKTFILFCAALLMFVISFVASIAMIGKSLTNSNIDSVVLQEQQGIKASYRTQIKGLTDQKRDELADIVAETNLKRNAVKEDFKTKFKPLDEMIEFQKKRPFKKGPNAGSVIGPDYLLALEKRNVLASQLEGELKEIRDTSSLNQTNIRDFYAAKIADLKAAEAMAVLNIDVGALANSDRADSQYVVAIKTMVSLITPLKPTSADIISFLSLLFSFSLELLTFLMPNLYRDVNRVRPELPSPERVVAKSSH
jgi:hypothetical protein